jgi:hypothetical protein
MSEPAHPTPEPQPTDPARPPDPDDLDLGIAPSSTQISEPHWIISLTKWGAEDHGTWWYAGDSAGSRCLASTPQRAVRFGTQAAAEQAAQPFRDNGDKDVEVLELIAAPRDRAVSREPRGHRSGHRAFLVGARNRLIRADAPGRLPLGLGRPMVRIPAKTTE